MKERKKLQGVFIFTLLYLLIFTIFSIINKNYEFLYYTIILSILITIIVFYYKKMHLTLHILIGLSILGFLHIIGGTLHFNGTRLYDLYLIKNFFRYDNLVHLLGTFIATIVGYNLIKRFLENIKYNPFLLYFILILIAMGVGAMNEILEFGAVVFLGAIKQVGDYFNNALDLFFNLIGSIIACLFIYLYNKKQIKKK